MKDIIDSFDVIVTIDDNIHVTFGESDLVNCSLKQYMEMLTDFKGEIYGAVWTDKGLMYVAEYVDGEWKSI